MNNIRITQNSFTSKRNSFIFKEKYIFVCCKFSVNIILFYTYWYRHNLYIFLMSTVKWQLRFSLRKRLSLRVFLIDERISVLPLHSHGSEQAVLFVTICAGNAYWHLFPPKICFSLLPALRSKRRLCYGNVAGWVAVCHSRYCIKTTKPTWKLFPPSSSPVIEAFGTPCADTKFQAGALNTRG